MQKWDYKVVTLVVVGAVDKSEAPVTVRGGLFVDGGESEAPVAVENELYIDGEEAEAPEGLLVLFKQLGEEGWEMCGVSTAAFSTSVTRAWVFKRPLS